MMKFLGLKKSHRGTYKELNRDKKKKLASLKDDMFLRAIILAVIHQLTPNIPVQLSRIAELSYSNVDEVKKQLKAILKLNPEYGEYLPLEEVFIRKLNVDHKIDPMISDELHESPPVINALQECSNCNTSQSILIRICANCGEELDFCEICKRGYSKSDIMSICPHCANTFHKTHIYAYIQAEGKCPVCKSHLLTDMII